MYIWSWTFLIIPAAVIIAGIGAFFAIKAIARKVKRKAAEQKAAKLAKAQEKQQEKTPEKTQEATLDQEQFITPNQPTPVVNPQVVQRTDVVAQNAKPSDAEYIKQIAALPFDAKDNEIVLGDKEKHTAWLIATKKLHNAEISAEVRAQVEAELGELNQYFENTYGHTPTMPSPANFAASVQDANGKTIYDFRNYCFDGNGAKNFQAACERDYTAQGRDYMPTIFQVDNENHPSLIVSSTQSEMFFAGVEDIKNTMQEQNMKNCNFYLITDTNKRELVQRQGTIKDIDALFKEFGLIDSKQTAPTKDDNLSK